MNLLVDITAKSVAAVFGITALVFGLQLLLFFPLTVVYEIWKYRSLRHIAINPFQGRVSVVVPAFNEEKSVLNCVESILASDYADLEVIVVNDGSTDATEHCLRDLIDNGRIKYICQRNSGKATALNRGAANATGEIILFTDADSLFLAKTVSQITRWFANPTVHAVCGNDTPLSARTTLQKVLAVTTHIGTGFIRRALSILGVMPIITGNLGAVRAETFREIGGFRQVWGEDLEFTFRLHEARKRIIFDSDPTVRAECPASLPALWRQRIRWVRSYVKVTRMHSHLLQPFTAFPFSLYLPINFLTQIVVPLLQLIALPLLLRLALSGNSAFHLGWNIAFYFGVLTFLGIAVYSIMLDRDPGTLRHVPLAVLAIVPLSYFYNFVVLISIWKEMRSEPEHWRKIERIPAGAGAARGGVTLALSGLLLIGLLVRIHFPERPAAFEAAPKPAKISVQQEHVRNMNLAIAIHFDAWKDWHEAVTSVLQNPGASLIHTVGVSAGRPEWTHFRWSGHRSLWSSLQRSTSADMLGESVRMFKEHGLRTVAVVDVYAPLLLRSRPEIAAIRFDGVRSPVQVCFTELVDGEFGQQIVEMAAYLAHNYPVDAIALTELGYNSYCYDDRCLDSYKRATAKPAWPTRIGTSAVDRNDPAIWEWRSARMEIFLAKIAKVVHAEGKKLIVDVPVSWEDFQRHGKDSGLDYTRVLREADQIVVWDYFGIEERSPRVSQALSQALSRDYLAERFSISIGLWGAHGTVMTPETFEHGLAYTLKGGVSNIWVTPTSYLTPGHWNAITTVFGKLNSQRRIPE